MTVLRSTRANSPPSLLHLAILAAVVGVTAWAGIALTQEAGRIASMWLPNGAVLAVLLTAARRHWPSYITTGFAANVAANLVTGDSPALALLLALANVVEVLLAAVPIRHVFGRTPDLARFRTFLHFSAYGVCLAPAGAGLLAAAALHFLHRQGFVEAYRTWTLADALGIAIVTPVALGIVRGDLAPLLRRGQRASSWLILLGAALTFAAVFAQTRYPLLFLVPPVLLAVAVRLDFAGLAVITPVLTSIAVLATVEGHGPFCLKAFVALPERIMLVQIFVLSSLLLSTWVAAGARERRAMQQALDEKHRRLLQSEQVLRGSEALHRLLAENSSDIIIRSNLDGIRTYVSPTVAGVLGFDPGELVGQDIRRAFHPDDVSIVAEARARLMGGGEREVALVRCSHKDGRWIWLEMRGRLLRDEAGQPREFVSSANDVTRRKLAEKRLEASLAELSLLATTDGLTGLANRRELDRQLAEACRRGVRSGQDVALLMIDADQFKAYNDRYGHYQGDEILRALAKVLKAAARRAGDLSARYGGEEFALLLPNTDSAGAIAIADDVLAEVRKLGLAHEGTASRLLTVSIGAACLRPAVSGDYLELMVRADRALYEAKRQGRNRRVLEAVPDLAVAAE